MPLEDVFGIKHFYEIVASRTCIQTSIVLLQVTLCDHTQMKAYLSDNAKLQVFICRVMTMNPSE